MSKIILFKKYITSPTLTLAVICFLLAGISFFYPAQKTVGHKVASKTVTPKPTSVLGETTTIAPTKVVVTEIVYPTTTPLPTQTHSASSGQATTVTTSTQISNPQVSMAVSEPDGTNTFTIDYHDSMNACDSLTEAKSEGKIKSVTLQWYASLNSNYVYEINGYKNNWTFTANGKSPLGCSLYTVSKGDSIVWKYN